jgi:Ca2+-binding EF-hand superfamily protein
MKINKQRLIAAIGTFGIAATLASTSVAQAPKEGAPDAKPQEPSREDRPGPESREGGRPGFGRPDGGRPEGGPGGMMRGEPKMVAQMMVERFDKDGDKKLDSEELLVALTEMRSMGGPGGPGGFGGPGGPGGFGGPGGAMAAGRMLEQNDKDKDGKLTGDEIPERMRENLARVDTNSDGSVDKAELEKMMSRMAGGPGGRGPRDGQPAEGDRPKRPPTEE